MWGTGEDSWTPVWAAEAERALRADKPLLASLCWGAARFPCLATADRKEAHERELDTHLRAARRLPVRFERRVVEVPAPVAVHFLQRRRMARPGVLHRLAVATARATGLLVATVDMPGTGESTVPLTPDADHVLRGLVAELRRAHPGPIGFYGASGQRIDVPGLPHGMAGNIGNALHLDAMPGPDVIDDLLARFSLREQGLLDRPGGSPPLARTAPVRQSLITGLRWIHSSLWSDWCMKAATSARLIVGLPFIGSRSAAL